MNIRTAIVNDSEKIIELMDQLDYPNTEPFIRKRITQLLEHPDHKLLVYELDNKVVACISIHYVPQLALKEDFAIISYLAVDNSVRSKGIGRELEEYCTQLAKERNCDRIQVHCNIRREHAHRFYERQEFQESRKYFSKKIKY